MRVLLGEGVDEVVDANSGFIIGNLEIGAPPNFMILILDPRENFQVLLDTKKYASFAMHDGRVVKNTLVKVLETEQQTEPADRPQKSSWLAYTPPPLAVPLGYIDTNKWNRFETRLVSGMFSAGLVVDRMNWLSQDASSEDTIGDLGLLCHQPAQHVLVVLGKHLTTPGYRDRPRRAAHRRQS